MRKISVPIYKFSELSDKAKQKAKDDYAAIFGYNWSEEALESLKALASHFDGSLKDYSIDWFGGSYSYAKFDIPDEMTKTEIKKRLKQLGSYNKKTLKGHGDCKLTGVFTDEAAIDGFREAFHEGETDLQKLLEEAFDSLLKECQKDCEASYEDEQFSETCEANDWEFYENGELVSTKKGRSPEAH